MFPRRNTAWPSWRRTLPTNLGAQTPVFWDLRIPEGQSRLGSIHKKRSPDGFGRVPLCCRPPTGRIFELGSEGHRRLLVLNRLEEGEPRVEVQVHLPYRAVPLFQDDDLADVFPLTFSFFLLADV